MKKSEAKSLPVLPLPPPAHIPTCAHGHAHTPLPLGGQTLGHSRGLLSRGNQPCAMWDQVLLSHLDRKLRPQEAEAPGSPAVKGGCIVPSTRRPGPDSDTVLRGYTASMGESTICSYAAPLCNHSSQRSSMSSQKPGFNVLACGKVSPPEPCFSNAQCASESLDYPVKKKILTQQAWDVGPKSASLMSSRSC